MGITVHMGLGRLESTREAKCNSYASLVLSKLPQCNNSRSQNFRYCYSVLGPEQGSEIILQERDKMLLLYT